MNHLEKACQVMEDGRAVLKAAGSSQWQNGTPDRNLLIKDINLGKLYGVYADGELASICAFSLIPDPSYKKIEGGAWLTDTDKYLTMHTFSIGAMFRGQGFYRYMFAKAEEVAKANGLVAIRADTYKLNKTMQHIFEKEGFKKCGVIYLVDETIDNDRLAYEKVL